MDNLDYAAKLQAINFLEERRKEIEFRELDKSDEFDRMPYIKYALKLLKY